MTCACRLGRDSALIAGWRLRLLRANPGRLIYPLAQPIVLLVLFVSVLGDLTVAGHGAGGSYRQFLIPGIIVQNGALTAPATGLGLLRDTTSGLADRFRSLPMSRAAALLGRLAADAAVLTAQAALLLAVAVAALGFRVRAGLAGGVGVVAVSVAFGLAVAVASAWLALVIRDAEAAERVLFFPAIALAFVSSAFSPVGALAAWMRPIARVNPVTAAADVIRSLASGGPAAAPALGLACWTAALIVVPGALAIRRWQSSP